MRPAIAYVAQSAKMIAFPIEQRIELDLHPLLVVLLS